MTLARIGASMVAAGMGLAACSSGSNTAATTTTTKAPDPATATAQISQDYQTLFNFAAKSTADKLAVVQGGSSLQTALAQALSSPLASGSAGAKVDAAQILPNAQCTAAKVTAPCAKVTYDILGANGQATLAGQTGYAVYTNGQWLVAKPTICGLLALFYNVSGKTGSPPGC
jgi:hypothetical protein